MKIRIAPLVLSLLTLSANLLLPIALRAQQPAPSPSGPVFHATANLVLVDVVVKNHGKPVEGIDCHRFHAFENGREQKIATCDEHTPPPAAEDRAVEERIAQMPAGIHTNADPHPAPSAINVLLLDYLNTTDTGSQLLMRQKALALIRSFKPGTRVAIFSLTSRLRMLLGFTSDAKADFEKILGPGATELPGSSLLAQTFNASGVYAPSTVDTIEENGGTSLDTEQTVEADEKKFSRDSRIRFTIQALTQLATFLSPLEGRKNIVWLGTGFPMIVPPDGKAKSAINVFGAQADYTAEVNSLARKLSALRVSVYPVDINGVTFPVKVAGVTSASYVPPDEETMKWIAEQTGGKAFYGNNDIATSALQAIDDGSRYYTIGYTPSDHRFDGGYRKIAVRLDDAGYQLSYRRGYNADPPAPLDAKTSAGIPLPRAALEHGAPQVADILLTAAALPADDPRVQPAALQPDAAQKPATARKSLTSRQYVVAVDVSTRRLSFQTAPDGKQTTQIMLAIQSYDRGGKPRRLTTQQYELTRAPGPIARNKPEIFRTHLAIALPMGRSYLRIAAVEPATSRTGSIEFPLEVNQ